MKRGIMNSQITQPMMQSRPNPTELRLMDSYIKLSKKKKKSIKENQKKKSWKNLLEIFFFKTMKWWKIHESEA